MDALCILTPSYASNSMFQALIYELCNPISDIHMLSNPCVSILKKKFVSNSWLD